VVFPVVRVIDLAENRVTACFDQHVLEAVGKIAISFVIALQVFRVERPDSPERFEEAVPDLVCEFLYLVSLVVLCRLDVALPQLIQRIYIHTRQSDHGDQPDAERDKA
jgi:hypothetical protein